MKNDTFLINRGIVLFMLLFLLSNVCRPVLCAAAAETGGTPLHPLKTKEKPLIDGELNDKAWQKPPLENPFITYSPNFGEVVSEKTLVWMAYDQKNLYFAFKCLDSEPQKIKTSVTQRDQIFNDDWVGLSLDALGNSQTSYHFFVNPSGIQGDELNSAVSGEDRSPDFVWQSAAKVTSEGYQVELAIPLRSIPFTSGEEVKMGVLFWRSHSRLGVSAAWPEIKPGMRIFNSHTPALYKGLQKQQKVEVLPSATYADNRERISSQQWGETDSAADFGIGLKYGLTSSVTAEVTVNPDFSQVESDVFQVGVNRRYPLFFREKRPFFMEGADIFNFFTLGNGFLPNAVHTRQIVNPMWSAKVTGTLGKSSFGLLSARDDRPDADNVLFTVGRGKYSLGKDNYIGFLYSGTEADKTYNRVAGVDFGLQFLKDHKINLSMLYSFSGTREPGAPQKDIANSSNFNAMYFYDSKSFSIETAFEHIGKDFRMDTSFLLRNGIDGGWVWSGLFFYPKSKSMPWIKRISPQVEFKYLHDLFTGMDDLTLSAGLNTSFTKRGYFNIYYNFLKESWQGQTFDLNQLEIWAGVQLFKWVRLAGSLAFGDSIFYDVSPSYTGDMVEGSFSVNLQPNKNLNQSFSFNHSRLSKNSQKLYDVTILYSKTTYQFNKYFFLRGILQYNTFQKRMLTDFLASFTLIPGTVVHAGYGGLYENRSAWRDQEPLHRQYRLRQQGGLINTRRSFFLKASYLWRF